MTDYVTKDSGERESFGSGAVRDVRGGKGRYDLISFLALHRIAGVYERGAAKYDDRNWEKGMPIGRFLDSALRHIGQYMTGQGDEDHLGQAAWNLVAALHFDEGIKRGLYPKELDDRPRYEPHDFGNFVPGPELTGDEPMPEVRHTSDEQARSPEVQMHDWSHSESEGSYHYHAYGLADGPAFPITPASEESVPHVHKRPSNG